MNNELKNWGIFINAPMFDILNQYPFKLWGYESYIESDLHPPLIQYVFSHNGISMSFDSNHIITAIFIHSNELGGFDEKLMNLSFSSTREQVRELFGVPNRSGDEFVHSILGKFGPFDLFDKDEYFIHFEYEPEVDRIRLITLMRPDIVPEERSF